MGSVRPRMALLASVLLLNLAALPTMSDEKTERRRPERSRESEVQQDEIMAALQRNEIRPLLEIMAAAEKAMPGQVVGVKVKRLNGAMVYELKIVSARGRLREIYINAATLDILKIE